MIKIIDIIRFYNEYDFLKSRLEFLKKEFQDKSYDIKTYAYISEVSNSGKTNIINYNKLEELESIFKFQFIIYNIPKNYIKSSSRSAEDYCFYYIDKSIRRENLLLNNDIIAWSDIDEVFDKSSINDAIEFLSKYKYCYTNMFSCFYNINFCFNENWPGTIFINRNCLLPLGTLKYSAHHTLRKNNIINTGIHLSYLRGTEDSKRVNSHFINFNNVRLILAQLGIHPQLRYSEYIKNNISKRKYKEFKSLEYQDKPIFRFIRKFITSNQIINFTIIFFLRSINYLFRLLKIIKLKF